MIPETEAVNGRSSDWRTAAICGRTQTFLMTERLAAQQLDFRTMKEGSCIRVMVRTNDLEAAMELRCDRESKKRPKASERPFQKRYARMLFSIPTGALLGNLVCQSFEVQSSSMPTILCLAFVIAFEICGSIVRAYSTQAMNECSNSKINPFTLPS